MQVLRLHKNNFNGIIPSNTCQLKLLQILDLGHNNLEGTIPSCFGNLGSMVMVPGNPEVSVGYSSEWFDGIMVEVIKGVETEYTRNLAWLVNMDLSSNNWSVKYLKS